MAFGVYEVVRVFGLLTMWLTSEADFVNSKTSKSQARGIKLLTWESPYSFGLRVLGAQVLAVREMDSLPTSTVTFGFYDAFGRNNTILIPFERRFMNQSLCKCDSSLSQDSVTKAPYFECFFFFLQQITGIFFCSTCSRGISEKSRKEICIVCSKSVF